MSQHLWELVFQKDEHSKMLVLNDPCLKNPLAWIFLNVFLWFQILGNDQWRDTKKPRQALVSSLLDSLGLSAAVAHAFVCKRLVWWIHGGKGLGCEYYIVDMQWFSRLKGIILKTWTYDMDIHQGHSSRTCSMDMKVYISKTCGMTCRIDMQHWHGQAARTYSSEMQQGHAVRKYSMCMQHVLYILDGHTAWK